MRILADTNILFSALLFPDSTPALALLKITENHELILCDNNRTEFKDILMRKAPNFLPAADKFLDELSYKLVPAVQNSEVKIRDEKDQPILDSAIKYDVDIIVTGDKDFLSMDIKKPKCMTAAEFLRM